VEQSLFDLAAEKLEQRSGMSQLEARGTLRIAVKSAGLNANGLTLEQLGVVFAKLMPGELEQRGVSDTAGVCVAVMADLGSTPAADAGAAATNPDDIFRRLAKA